MKSETKGNITVGIWGLIGGAILAMVIGFQWGGWTTSSTTQKMNEGAVLKSDAAICVAQFTQDPKYKENLKAFEKLDSYDRHEFIGKGGWDKMPGQKDAASGVGEACADGLQSTLSMKAKN